MVNVLIFRFHRFTTVAGAPGYGVGSRIKTLFCFSIVICLNLPDLPDYKLRSHGWYADSYRGDNK